MLAKHKIRVKLYRVLTYILTLFILVDFPIHRDTIRLGLPIISLKWSLVIFLNYDVFLSLKVGLMLANSVDPDEMQHRTAFYLGLHYLPKYPFRVYPFRGFQYTHG